MKIMHIGVPTTQVQKDETFMDGLKVYITDPDKSEFGFEYLRFVPGTPLPESLQFRTHVAVQVDNFDELIKKYLPIFGPAVVDEHLTIAFIETEHTLLELMDVH